MGSLLTMGVHSYGLCTPVQTMGVHTTMGVHNYSKCLMENSDLIARTSCGENNGENTITSIERFTQVYKHNQ